MDYVQAAIAYYRQGLRAASYSDYLQSEHWKLVRRKALERAGFRCQQCSRLDYLNVHHLSYAHLGNERMDELIVLCKKCHGERHGVTQNGNALGKAIR